LGCFSYRYFPFSIIIVIEFQCAVDGYALNNNQIIQCVTRIISTQGIETELSQIRLFYPLDNKIAPTLQKISKTFVNAFI